jgi:hypothetical protein
MCGVCAAAPETPDDDHARHALDGTVDAEPDQRSTRQHAGDDRDDTSIVIQARLDHASTCARRTSAARRRAKNAGVCHPRPSVAMPAPGRRRVER